MQLAKDESNIAGENENGIPAKIVSPAINDTRLNRFLTIAVFKVLRRFRPQHGVVLFATKSICIKSGVFTPLSEGSTLQFIAKHTTIPVPKVYCSFVSNGRTFLVLERIHGQSLARKWPSLTEDSRRKILAQLKGYVEVLRNLACPQDFGIANVDGGPLCDGRIPNGTPQFGPFRSAHDFHEFLRGGLKREPGYDSEIDQMMEFQDGPWPPPVFTHGDLSSLNILIRGDEIVGVIDWEISGWYPSYWEYTTACQVNIRNLFWRAEIDKFIAPDPHALAMDQVRLKFFGDT